MIHDYHYTQQQVMNGNHNNDHSKIAYGCGCQICGEYESQRFCLLKCDFHMLYYITILTNRQTLGYAYIICYIHVAILAMQISVH